MIYAKNREEKNRFILQKSLTTKAQRHKERMNMVKTKTVDFFNNIKFSALVTWWFKKGEKNNGKEKIKSTIFMYRELMS